MGGQFCLLFIVFPIDLFEDNEGAIAVEEDPLHSGKSKHIDVRRHFIRNLVKTKTITVTHVESRGQRADIFTKALSILLLKRHRKGLMTLRDGK